MLKLLKSMLLIILSLHMPAIFATSNINSQSYINFKLVVKEVKLIQNDQNHLLLSSVIKKSIVTYHTDEAPIIQGEMPLNMFLQAWSKSRFDVPRIIYLTLDHHDYRVDAAWQGTSSTQVYFLVHKMALSPEIPSMPSHHLNFKIFGRRSQYTYYNLHFPVIKTSSWDLMGV